MDSPSLVVLLPVLWVLVDVPTGLLLEVHTGGREGGGGGRKGGREGGRKEGRGEIQHFLSSPVGLGKHGPESPPLSPCWREGGREGGRQGGRDK